MEGDCCPEPRLARHRADKRQDVARVAHDAWGRGCREGESACVLRAQGSQAAGRTSPDAREALALGLLLPVDKVVAAPRLEDWTRRRRKRDRRQSDVCELLGRWGLKTAGGEGAGTHSRRPWAASASRRSRRQSRACGRARACWRRPSRRRGCGRSSASSPGSTRPSRTCA